MVVPFVYTEEEYKKLEKEIWKIREVNRENCSLLDEFSEKIRFLEQCLDNKEKVNKSMREENKKLKNSIEYRKKKADKNQEKANQIDKIMNLPWVMVDWKIDWSKVAVYYCI